MEVAAHLWGVIGRYRFAATADRVRVTLVGADGRSDMHSLVIRCVPGPAGLARLELGQLVLVAREGRLRAVHRRDPTTYAELGAGDGAEGPGAVLRDLLPPLAIPQISLAFDHADVDWCPLVGGLRWEHAERIRLGDHEGVRLRGSSDAGEAVLELVGARVRRFEAALEAEGPSRLIVQCEPLDPGDPAGWALDVAGRKLVSGLGALRALGSSIGVGGRLPRLVLMHEATGETSRLGEDADPGTSPETRLHAVMLVRDDTPAQTTSAATLAVLHGATELQRELLRGRIDGRYDERIRLVDVLGVVQAQTSGGILERIAAQVDAWNAAVASARPAESERPEMVWTGGEARLIDRLAPGAAAVLVLHDGSGEILAVHPLAETSTPTDVADALVGGVPPLPVR